MAYYLVRARLKPGLARELADRNRSGEFATLHPFGPALTRSLAGARRDPETGQALWEEEDYCRPPLAQERAAVLDHYFDDITVEPVSPGAGWQQVDHLPSLWAQAEG